MFLRVLAYERNLPEHAGRSVDILVVGTEEVHLASLHAALGSTPHTVHGLPVTSRSHLWTDAPSLEAALQERDCDVVLVMGDALGDDLSALLAVTRREQLISLSTSREDVRHGVSVGVVIEDQWPSLVVNLGGAAA